MTVESNVADECPVRAVDTVELSEEQLQQVVGGLDRAWWPDPNDWSSPETMG